MEAVWYYAENNEQRGPVSGLELLALEQSGRLRAASLVWQAGMANWQPWSSVAPSVRSAAGLAGEAPLEEVAVCAYSGQTRPLSLMVRYGDRWVALEYKEAFLQSLREGAPVARMAGVNEIQYVGFWWRVLAMIIDAFVLMVPNLLVAAPYYYLYFKKAFAGGLRPNPDPFAEMRNMEPIMVVAYVGSIVGSFLISMAYETWMVGKWSATVGKMVIGARVTKVGGETLTYLQALGRFGAKLVNMLIWIVPSYGLMILGVLATAGMFGTGGKDSNAAPILFVVCFVVAMLWSLAGAFGYYMAGWTQRKQALHDKMARTVVVKKHPV